MPSTIKFAQVERAREWIRSNYLDRGIVLVWPESLVMAGFGTQEDAYAILKVLVNQGFLEEEAEVRSWNGRVVWRGSPNDLRSRIKLLDDEEDESVRITFSISSELQEILAEKKALKG